MVEGATLREHLTGMWERTGVKPDRLSAHPLPRGCETLWRDFTALHSCRASGMGGPSRISWADLDAYQRVMGIRLAPWEVEAIRRADTAFMSAYAATRKP